MAVPNAKFSIDDDGGGFVDPTNGVDVAAGSVITCRIDSMAGIQSSTIDWEIIGTHDSSVAKPSLTLGGTPNGQTAQFTVPAGSGAYGIRCTVNGGPDAKGKDNPASTRFSAGVYVLFGNGFRPFFIGEEFQAQETHGVVERFNDMLEGLGGGGSGYTTVQEEGAGLTQRAVMNFIGTYCTAADNAGSSRTDVTFSAITNADIDAAAAIAFSKLATDVTWAAVLGNGSLSVGGGTDNPKLASGDAYDTDTAVNWQAAVAGTTWLDCDGSTADFQAIDLQTTGYMQPDHVRLGGPGASIPGFGGVRAPNNVGFVSRTIGGTGVNLISIDASDVLSIGASAVSSLAITVGGALQMSLDASTADFQDNAITTTGGVTGSFFDTSAGSVGTGAFRMGRNEYVYSEDGANDLRVIGVTIGDRIAIGQDDVNLEGIELLLEATKQLQVNHGGGISHAFAEDFYRIGDGTVPGTGMIRSAWTAGATRASWYTRDEANSVNYHMVSRDSSNVMHLGNGTGVDIDDNFLEIDDRTAPSSPSSGARIYIDSADSKLKVKFDTGSVKELAVP